MCQGKRNRGLETNTHYSVRSPPLQRHRRDLTFPLVHYRRDASLYHTSAHATCVTWCLDDELAASHHDGGVTSRDAFCRSAPSRPSCVWSAAFSGFSQLYYLPHVAPDLTSRTGERTTAPSTLSHAIPAVWRRLQLTRVCHGTRRRSSTHRRRRALWCTDVTCQLSHLPATDEQLSTVNNHIQLNRTQFTAAE